MDPEKAASELKVIRELMERPIRYSTMSGLSGIWAGLVALAGVAADDWVCGQFIDFNQYDRAAAERAMWANLGIWVAVLIVAATGVLVLTRLREKKQGMPTWSNIKKRIALTLVPAVVGGIGLTLVIVARWYCEVPPNEWGLIPVIWMLFYGGAMWQLGEFSPVEVRVLGAAFLLAGLVTAAVFQDCPYWAMGITFGGFHIVYGIVVWIRHGG